MSSNSNSTRSSEGKVIIANGKDKNKEKHQDLPKTLDYLFEKELINNQNKHIYIMDKYGPSKNRYVVYIVTLNANGPHYLSTKFYARHEQQAFQNAATFIPFLYGSSYTHDTEANVYGWMPKTIKNLNLLKELNFVSAPKQRCCLTIFGEKLESDRKNARPDFNGLRFILQ